MRMKQEWLNYFDNYAGYKENSYERLALLYYVQHRTSLMYTIQSLQKVGHDNFTIVRMIRRAKPWRDRYRKPCNSCICEILRVNGVPKKCDCGQKPSGV